MNAHGSHWIRPDKRLALYIRDGFGCLYCGADLRDSPPAGITLDHLETRSNGGHNEASNLVTACLRCNSQRRDRSWREYATGGAIWRIEEKRERPLNMGLARELLAKRWR